MKDHNQDISTSKLIRRKYNCMTGKTELDLRDDPVEQNKRATEDYIKYLETRATMQSLHIAALEAAASVLLIKLSCNRDPSTALHRMADVLQRNPITLDRLKLIQQWYAE